MADVTAFWGKLAELNQAINAPQIRQFATLTQQSFLYPCRLGAMSMVSRNSTPCSKIYKRVVAR